jgi:predicted SnoaL-like aldol condensation-catalyzing enzyme
VHLVDTVEVEPERVEEYVEVVRALGLAVMTDAGASFVSCATTSSEIGERVWVQVTWSFDDHEHWDVIRKNLVLDPRYHEYGARLSSLRVGGTRRFFTPTALSPAP